MSSVSTPVSGSPAAAQSATHTPAVVDALIDVGLGWARYGLMTGRLAVQTHAALLRSTASLLDEAATLLDVRLHAAGPAAPVPPAAATPSAP